MRVRKGKTVGLLLVVLLASWTLTGCRIGDTEIVFGGKKVDNRTLFKVDGYSCSVKEANIYLYNYKNLYGHAYGVNLWDNPDRAVELEMYVKDIALEELGRIICMDILADEQGVVLSESEQNLVRSTAKKYFDSLSEEEIAHMEIRLGDVETAYEHYALAQKVYRTMTLDVEGEVSDDEARVIHIQQIFVTGESEAQQIEERLLAEEEFVNIAAYFNEAGNMEKTAARGDLPKQVEDVAFNLENGECSAKIQTEDGYYFVKCINKFDKELTEANKANILVRREKQQFEQAYENVVKNAQFLINEEIWESMILMDAEMVTTDSFFSTYEDLW